MLNLNYTTLQPATPTLLDMLGAKIEYINFRPYQRQPMNAIGIVIGYKNHKNTFFLKVQNSTTCRERWIAESDFVGYVREV